MNHAAEHSRADVKVIIVLTLVHFTGDFYASFIHPLLPVFVEKYSLNLTQVGLLTGITRLLAFVVQPSVGYVADRFRTRLFVLGGLTLAIVFIPAPSWRDFLSWLRCRSGWQWPRNWLPGADLWSPAL